MEASLSATGSACISEGSPSGRVKTSCELLFSEGSEQSALGGMGSEAGNGTAAVGQGWQPHTEVAFGETWMPLPVTPEMFYFLC